ncbi:MAG TPA: hypothetical protein VFW78_02615 [Bacteroidia bacterium]|nr:hypothetical protein [Bacteroidia bacterium]
MRIRKEVSTGWIRRVLFLFVMLIPLTVFAQDGGKATKKQKKAEAKKEQQKEQARKSEVRARKEHMKLQDKKTRKRMKKNRKKGKSYVSSGNAPGFFKRLFHKPH